MRPAPTPRSRERLALLVAGAGRRIRTRVAEDPDTPPLRLLEGHRGRYEACRRQAHRSLDVEVPRILQQCADLGFRWMAPGDEGYPGALAATSDPPLGLFVRGRLGAAAAVAVVGTRRATAYGRRIASALGRSLGAAGVPVVSGMAHGVDAAAHRGCLEAGGPTVAVWGTGPDRVYPADHADLAEAIVDGGGALVTEMPPGTPVQRHHFPLRNRVIAGLVASVVVVEAPRRSGALGTAAVALEDGREVWAVPGSILSPASQGSNALLRDGARPLLAPEELLEELPAQPALPFRPPEEDDHPLLAALPHGEPRHPDELARELGLSAEVLAASLFDLELEGVVERGADGRVRRS